MEIRRLRCVSLHLLGYGEPNGLSLVPVSKSRLTVQTQALKYRQYLLSYSWNSTVNESARLSSTVFLYRELLAAYAQAPGKATDSSKRYVAEGTNESFQIAIACGFHDFFFLSDDGKEAPFEAFLGKHLAKSSSEPRLWLQKLDAHHLRRCRALGYRCS